MDIGSRNCVSNPARPLYILEKAEKRKRKDTRILKVHGRYFLVLVIMENFFFNDQ
jgi:hypothetical protein